MAPDLLGSRPELAQDTKTSSVTPIGPTRFKSLHYNPQIYIYIYTIYIYIYIYIPAPKPEFRLALPQIFRDAGKTTLFGMCLKSLVLLKGGSKAGQETKLEQEQEARDRIGTEEPPEEAGSKRRTSKMREKEQEAEQQESGEEREGRTWAISRARQQQQFQRFRFGYRLEHWHAATTVGPAGANKKHEQ